MKKIISLITSYFLIVVNVNSQKINDSLVKIFIPYDLHPCTDTFIDVPLKGKSFTNIINLQGTINWDNAVLNLNSINVNTSIPNMSVSDWFFPTIYSNMSYLYFIYTNAFQNITVADSTTILTLRFKILSKVVKSCSVSFSNYPTVLGIDTAADIVGLSDWASLGDSAYWKSGIINFSDTPLLVQENNKFYSVTNCASPFYVWKTFDCNGNLITIDTTLVNVFVSPLPDTSCYSVQCFTRKQNGIIQGSGILNNSLPLKLLSFNAKQETRNVVLNWQTSNEVNVSHINIQRSNNGKDFTTIGKANASCCEYSYTDNQLPITTDKLTLYYRLEIVDKDGIKTYSSIQQITINAKLSTLNIYPNPSNGSVTIDCAGAKELLIIDYLGRTVKQYNNIKGQLTVNTNQFTKGIYIVKAILKNNTETNCKLIAN